MFSRRASRDSSLNSLALLLERTGTPRFDLTGSNPTRAGIPSAELLPLLARAVGESHRYAPEPFGALAARRAVAEHVFAAAVDPADVLLGASSSEAYSFLFKLLCDAGDAVLVPAPSYPLFEHLAELEGVQPIAYRLAYDGAWHIDFDSLERALTPRVRAIVVVSPNNPTGHYGSADERARLEALGLPLLVDEVFYEYDLGAEPRRRERERERGEPPVLTFSLGGLSKLAGLPQVKLGWTLIEGPAELRRAARERLELIADTYLSLATPIQLALPALLPACAPITAAIRARCRSSLATLARLLEGSPISLLRAEAGWSAVLRLPGLQSEEELVLGLLAEQGVLVQPGWFYDFDSEPYVVVSLLTEPATLEAGVERLVQHVTKIAG